MGKKFNEWLDEFVEQGADATDVSNWPQEAGGGGLVHHKITFGGGDECDPQINGVIDVYCDKTDLFDLDSFIEYGPTVTDMNTSTEGIAFVADITGVSASFFPFAIYNGYYKSGVNEGFKFSYCYDGAGYQQDHLQTTYVEQQFIYTFLDEIVND